MATRKRSAGSRWGSCTRSFLRNLRRDRSFPHGERVQRVDACDLFIAVNAGTSSAQFEMESLPAIVLPQSQIVAAPARTTPSDHLFAAQTPAAQPLPAMLNEVPQGIPLNDPAANQGDCSESRPGGTATASIFAGTGTPCDSPSEPKVETPPPGESPASLPGPLEKRTPSEEQSRTGGAAPPPSEAPSTFFPSAADPSASRCQRTSEAVASRKTKANLGSESTEATIRREADQERRANGEQ